MPGSTYNSIVQGLADCWIRVRECMRSILAAVILFFISQSYKKWVTNSLLSSELAYQQQEKTLIGLLSLNANTDRGQRYGYSSIRTIEQFQSTHPITTYAEYEADLQEIWDGTKTHRVLSESPIVWLCSSSGTTGKRKKLPLTRPLGMSLALSMVRTIGWFISEFGLFSFASGRASVFAAGGCKARTQKSPSGIPYGALSKTVSSSRVETLMKRFFFNIMMVNYVDVSEMEHSDAALVVLMITSLAERNLQFISAAFSPYFVHAFQLLYKYWPECLEALEFCDSSRVSLLKENLPQEALLAFDRYLWWFQTSSERHSRCQYLHRVFSARDCSSFASFAKAQPDNSEYLCNLSIAEALWPDMKSVSAAVTGSFEIYRDDMDYIRGKLPICMCVYAASEGGLGGQVSRHCDQYVLYQDSMFFEFIPEAEIPSDEPSTLVMGQLELGQRYELVITNHAGFSRYRIGDVIEVRHIYDNGGIAVSVCYRQGSLYDAVGEMTSEDCVSEAVKRAAMKWGQSAVNFTGYVRTDLSPMCYEIFVELLGVEGEEEIVLSEEELLILDQELCQVRPDYEECARKKLAPIRCVLVRNGTFDRFIEILVEDGGAALQVKVPHLLKRDSHKAYFRENAVCGL